MRIQKLSQMKMRTNSRKCDYIRCDTVSHFDFFTIQQNSQKTKSRFVNSFINKLIDNCFLLW